MRVENIWATSTYEIQKAIQNLNVLAVSYGASKWAMPGLATNICDYSSTCSLLEDIVPYIIDDERRMSSKSFYESKLADIESNYPELSDSNDRIGILVSRPNSSIIDFSPGDQTVTVSGGISIRKLNKFLAEAGQCIPLPNYPLRGSNRLSAIHSLGSVDKQIYLNLPHNHESQCGSWRDWVLGMKLVLANGELVTVGSKVVKNVAGFDLHKLMIGSLGTLAVIAEVTLRTCPLRNLPTPNVQEFDRLENTTGELRKMYTWIQRVPLSELSKAIDATKPYLREVDLNTGTLWGLSPIEIEVPKWPGGWMIRDRSGTKNMVIENPAQIAIMKRTKAIFDPTNKLNPGVFGFL